MVISVRVIRAVVPRSLGTGETIAAGCSIGLDVAQEVTVTLRIVVRTVGATTMEGARVAKQIRD